MRVAGVVREDQGADPPALAMMSGPCVGGPLPCQGAHPGAAQQDGVAAGSRQQAAERRHSGSPHTTASAPLGSSHPCRQQAEWTKRRTGRTVVLVFVCG